MVFEVFRKRQKEMLAVMVLVAMFIFIGGDFVTRMVYGDRSQPGGPRVGEIWNKPRTAEDIQRLETERYAARGVLDRLVKAAGTSGDRSRLETVFGDFTWQSLAYAGVDWRPAYLALEGKADQLGVRATDDDVTQFIKQITGDTVTREQFKEALTPPKRASPSSRDRGDSVSESELYRIVARELKVRRALQALSETADDVAPLDFWRKPVEHARTLYHLEMVRLPTDKFIDPKAEPATADLQPIYNRYKSVSPDPERGVVGFQRPATAEFEYASIPVEKWLDQVQVTDEEAKKYYDLNPHEFPDDLPIPPPQEPKGLNPAALPDKAGGAMPKAQVPSPPPVKSPPKTDEKAPPAKADAKGKADEKKAGPETKAGAEKKTSGTPALDLLRTVAVTSLYVQTPDPKKGQEKKAGDQRPAPAKAEEKKPAPKQDDKKPEAPKVAEKKGADPKNAAPPFPVPPNAPGQAKAGEGVSAPKVKPYVTVKAEIERKLKMQKARQVVRDRLKKAIDDKLAPFAEKYILARREFENRNKGNLEGFAPPTPPLTMEALAKDFRGDFHRIGPTTRRDVEKMPGFGRLTQAVEAVFSERKPTYAAETETDLEENVFYVYWRTKLTPPSEASFESVRDQLVTLWRREQAQKPAQKAAEELAEKVKKSGFAEAVKGTDYKPFTPGAFRRATYIPGAGNAVRLTQMQPFPTPALQGVPDAKTEFLDQAAQLEEGEVKVIPGDQRENFYVVKCVKREEPSFEEFASEYEYFVRRSSQQREMIAQQQAAMTALRVLEESGFNARGASDKRGRTAGDEPGDNAQ